MIHSLHCFHPCHRAVIHLAFFCWMDMKIVICVAANDHYVSRGAQIALKIGDRSAGPLIKNGEIERYLNSALNPDFGAEPASVVETVFETPALPFPFSLQPTFHTFTAKTPAIASTPRIFFFMVPFIFISKTPHQLLVSKLLRIGSGRARR